MKLADVLHDQCLPGSLAYAPLTVLLSPNGSFGDFTTHEFGHTHLEYVSRGGKGACRALMLTSKLPLDLMHRKNLQFQEPGTLMAVCNGCAAPRCSDRANSCCMCVDRGHVPPDTWQPRQAAVLGQEPEAGKPGACGTQTLPGVCCTRGQSQPFSGRQALPQHTQRHRSALMRDCGGVVGPARRAWMHQVPCRGLCPRR